MRYGSVCSGIEAATAAWHHMGWEAAFFSEIEAFPRAILEYHYPEVPLHGDFTTIGENQYGKIDLLVGGTPCQSFSVAGLRGGLDDERGNLALEFCRLAQREQPRWIVWENVPGVLSSNGGRDFGSILGALEDLGYGLAYRVLDAQYFGVAQRRRRVFVVGYLGDWRPAAAVLFERHSMSGHPAPSREARKEAARAALSGAEERGGCGGDGPSVGWPADVACTLDTDFASKWGQNNQHVNAGCPLFVPSVAYSIMPMNSGKDYKARETEVAQPIMAGGPAGDNQGGDYVVQPTIAIQDVRGIDKAQNGKGWSDEGTSYTVDTRATQGVSYPVVTPFDTTQITSPHNYSSPKDGDPCHPLAAGAHPPAIAIQERAVCENPSAGPDGIGVRTDDVAYTLEARTTPRAVAFAQNTRDEVRIIGGDGEIAGALAAQPGMKQTTYIAFSAKDHGGDATEELSPTLRAGGFTNSHQNGGVMPAVATGVFYGGQGAKAGSIAYSNEVSPTLKAGNSGTNRSPSAHIGSAVRRLTPVECERLQGFPDNFTAIPWKKKGPEQCPDGPRYKALGNSMAVPVMRWIGERIQLVDDIISLL